MAVARYLKGDRMTLAEIFLPYREISRRNSELASAESVRDDYKSQLAKFDRDGDGKPGGSRPKGKAA